jgi:hypothetical protein
MAVIVGYEHLAAYLEEAQAFRATRKPSPEDSNYEDAPEDQIFNKLTKWLPQSPPKGYFTTLGYFRHMRNSFAHGHVVPSKEFSAFAANHSHSLNKFWTNGVTDLGYATRDQLRMLFLKVVPFVNGCSRGQSTSTARSRRARWERSSKEV